MTAKWRHWSEDKQFKIGMTIFVIGFILVIILIGPLFVASFIWDDFRFLAVMALPIVIMALGFLVMTINLLFDLWR